MNWQSTDAPDTLPYAEKVDEWMRQQWADNPCAVCGAQDWRPEGRLFFLQRLMPAEDLVGEVTEVPGIGRPVFPVVCMKCGNAHLIHAVVAGVLER